MFDVAPQLLVVRALLGHDQWWHRLSPAWCPVPQLAEQADLESSTMVNPWLQCNPTKQDLHFYGSKTSCSIQSAVYLRLFVCTKSGCLIGKRNHKVITFDHHSISLIMLFLLQTTDTNWRGSQPICGWPLHTIHRGLAVTENVARSGWVKLVMHIFKKVSSYVTVDVCGFLFCLPRKCT